MRTKTLFAILIIAILGLVLIAGYFISPLCITVVIACIAAMASYELIHNITKVNNKAIIVVVCIYSIATVIGGHYSFNAIIISTVLYSIYSAIFILFYNSELDLSKIVMVYSIPIPFSIAFFMFDYVVNYSNNFYYLLLLFGFSSVCDICAYFTGMTIGKHKLCPKISPNKTIEGAIGGIVGGTVFSIVMSILFNQFDIALIIVSIPLCILGIAGDLFASVIKRSVGVKDYSNLIPGHGGIMDRFDSVIMIVPLMYLLITYGII